MSSNNMTNRSINFREQINQFIKGYRTDPAKGLLHGFQKDIIQNSWGNRKSTNNNNKDWKMTIQYLENSKGKFLIVEDHNSTGLIGNNFSQTQITRMMENSETLSGKEKLARFQSLYNSGENINGAGLFGRGKMMYQAVSESNKYFFDTLTEEENYYANCVELQNILEQALEGEIAKKYIFSETGLQEKRTHGTRIIICDPKKEIIEGIKTGKILEDINETWWRIFAKYDAVIEVYDNEEIIGKGMIPEIYKKYIGDSKYFEEYNNIPVNENYRVKHLGIFYVDENEELPEELGNISYYRSDMKIGDVYNVNALPIDDKYKKRVAGYIEFDKTWEEDLSINEDLEHYGPQNKRNNSFQFIKNIIEKKLDIFAINKGIKKKNKYRDEDEELKGIVNDLTDFLQDFNIKFDFDTAQKINAKSPLKIEVQKKYPNEGSRRLFANQTVKTYITIKNTSVISEFILSAKAITVKGTNCLHEEEVQIFNEYNFELDIDYSKLFLEEKNLIQIECKSKNGEILERSNFPIFVDIEETKEIDDFTLMILDYEMPNDSKSIYLNEKIKNVKIRVSNNINYSGKFSLAVLTQDIKDRNATIETVYRNNNVELKCGEEKIIEIGDILFDEKYIKRRGPIKIKFKLTHIEGIKEYEKGDTLLEPGITVFFDTEEESIGGNLFKTVSNPLDDKYMKTKLDPAKDNSYILTFNTNYPSWKEISSDTSAPSYKLYCVTEMLHALILIQFKRLNFSITGKKDSEIEEMSPNEIFEETKKIVDHYVGQYMEKRL